MNHKKELNRKIRSAIGIAYDSGVGDSPTISVKGDDLIADKIVNLAVRYNVPIVERPELVSALSTFEIDQEIPESLFEPVAILLHEIKELWRSNRKPF